MREYCLRQSVREDGSLRLLFNHDPKLYWPGVFASTKQASKGWETGEKRILDLKWIDFERGRVVLRFEDVSGKRTRDFQFDISYEDLGRLVAAAMEHRPAA